MPLCAPGVRKAALCWADSNRCCMIQQRGTGQGYKTHQVTFAFRFNQVGVQTFDVAAPLQINHDIDLNTLPLVAFYKGCLEKGSRPRVHGFDKPLLSRWLRFQVCECYAAVLHAA